MKQQIVTWKLQPLHESIPAGQFVSRKGFDDSNWHSVTIPNSIVGNYVEAGVFEDPYFGTAMKDIPGYKHGRTVHFAFHRMPDESPFRKAFWYRSSFIVKPVDAEKQFHIKFDGLNYRANIWVNGKRIAGDAFVNGTYRQYDFPISFWTTSGENTIAVELTPQEPDELGMSFIDWSPVAPDDSAGIWQPVTVYSTGVVALKHPTIRTSLNNIYDEAQLTAELTLVNLSKEPTESSITVKVLDETITLNCSLRSLETKIVTLTADQYPQLNIKNPQLWWPWNMGDQPLFKATFSVSTGGSVSDSSEITFGIREIVAEINSHGSRHFKINGKEILIRGTAWSPDLLLRQDHSKEILDIAYLKQMNFNTVRIEGKMGSDHLWDVCDREGILALAGWECCTHWEQWDKWKPDDYEVARQSQRSQLLRLRNHASFAAWFYGSDFPPIEPVEQIYLEELAAHAPTLAKISSAAAFPSTLTGPSGVKMSGPYGYVPPSYWYNDDMPGHAISFNTETGPDSSYPRYETVCKMIPDESQQYVGSDSWNHHAGLASFITTEVMDNAIETRYGVKRTDLKKYLAVAQINSFEAWRGMYEAYARNYPKGTGVIGWMMNGHWPSLIWQMYDFWMFPTGGFFGARRACAPIHLQYSYDDRSIWIVNDTHESFKGFAIIELFTSNGERFSQNVDSVSLKPMERHLFSSPEYPAEELFFLSLKIKDEENKMIDRNVYWLSKTVEIFKAERVPTEWYYRPLIRPTDFSSLITLPQSSLTIEKEENENGYMLTITNNGKNVAVSVLIDLIDSEKNPIAGGLWSDNYLMVMPKEQVSVSVDLKYVDRSTVHGIHVSGINIEDQWL